jgi:hypothetical protein
MNRPKGGFIPWDYGDDPPAAFLGAEPMPWTGDLQSFKDAYFERAIGAYEHAWHSGYEPALNDAIQLCREHERPLPTWLNDAVVAEKTRRRGRQASAAGEERDRYVHWRRWDLACAALDAREYLPSVGFPSTRDGAFAWASTQLRGTAAQGGPDSVERSYKKVCRAIKKGEGAKFVVTKHYSHRPREAG